MERRLLGVHAINPGGGGSSSGGGGSGSGEGNNAAYNATRVVGASQPPTTPSQTVCEWAEWVSKEAKAFGERLAEKTASDWARVQAVDKTASTAIELIAEGVEVKDIKQTSVPNEVGLGDVKRLAAQVTI